MKPCVFTGSAVAIVTPFCGDGVDLEAFDRLIERQIQGGTDAIVVCGTTGEAATLSYNERMALIERCVRTVDRRVPVIAGSGTNSTASSIALSKAAQSAGVDALLTVTPYYNKTTQRGLIKHFFAVADAVDKPIILYNVPSRTGVNIKPETCAELAKHERICAIKEASGSISAVAEIRYHCGDTLDIYSGNDDQITSALALGAQGVISVLSNILPKETHEICRSYFDGDSSLSDSLQLKYLDLIEALFLDVNPIPVKQAMRAMGYDVGRCRLPLCDMDPTNAEKLYSVLKQYGLVENVKAGSVTVRRASGTGRVLQSNV